MKYKPTLHKLSNGVTVILDPMNIETAVVSVCFKTGSRDELPNEQGLTHFCEHMLCKGTTRFPTKKAMDDYMELHGGLRSAATGHASIYFDGKILAKNLNILIDFIGEQIQNSLFLPEQIEIERNVIIDELRQIMDDPDEQIGYFISQTLFGGGTQCYTTLGNVENIMSFTRQQMIDFLHKRFSANNCIIGISGKIIDADSTLKCLENSFSFLPTHSVSQNTDLIYTPTCAHNFSPEKKNVKLRIIFPDVWEQTYKNLYAQKCVDKFEKFLFRKLYRVLRYENGLVYGIDAANIGNEKKNWNMFATETSKNNLAQTIALLAKNSYKYYNEIMLTEKDLFRFRCGTQLFDADWLESSSNRCRALVSFYYNFGKLYNYTKLKEMDESITVEDVVEKTRGYFDGGISIITQGSNFTADLKSIWLENFKHFD